MWAYVCGNKMMKSNKIHLIKPIVFEHVHCCFLILLIERFIWLDTATTTEYRFPRLNWVTDRPTKRLAFF